MMMDHCSNLTFETAREFYISPSRPDNACDSSEDIFEVSRYSACSLRPSPGLSLEVETGKRITATTIPSPEVEAGYWLRDEPMDCGTPSQGSSSSRIIQGSSMSSSDFAHSFNAAPLLCMSGQPGEKEFSQLCTQQNLKGSIPLHLFGSLKTSDHIPQAIDHEFFQDSIANTQPHLSTTRNHGQRESLKSSQDENANSELLKDIQLSQWLKENGYHLSIADTKNIKLKVSAVQEATKRFGGGERGMLEALRHILDCANNSIVSDPIQQVMHGSFKDLQDLASLQSLSEMSYQKYFESFENESHTNGGQVFSDTLHLSSSLSSLSSSLSSTEDLTSVQTSHQTKPPHLGVLDDPLPSASRLGASHLGAAQAGFDVYNRDNSLYCPSPLNSHLMSVAHPTFSHLPLEVLSIPPFLFQAEPFGEEIVRVDQAVPKNPFGPDVHERERKPLTGVQSPLESTPSLNTRDKDSSKWSSPAATTRAARKRRMARQRRTVHNHSRITVQTSTSSLAWSQALPQSGCTRSVPFQTQEHDVAPSTIEGQTSSLDINLRFLLQKELKPSDVGNLGRIVLPKKDAETKLPYLIAREGITLPMDDMTSSQVWNLRFRFWPNNKSRMYLLENTGDFIKSHHLQEGDFMIIYKDDAAGKYIIRAKKVAQLDSSSTTCGRRIPISTPLQGKHTVIGDRESDTTSLSSGAGINEGAYVVESRTDLNTHEDSSPMEESIQNLDESFLKEFVQGLPDVSRIETDILPQLEHVPGLETNDMPIEEIFDLRDQDEEESSTQNHKF